MGDSFHSNSPPDVIVFVMRVVRDFFSDATVIQDTSVNWMVTREIVFDEQLNNYSCGFYVVGAMGKVSETCLPAIPEVRFESDTIYQKSDYVQDVCTYVYTRSAVQEFELAGKDNDMSFVLKALVTPNP